MPSIPLLRRPQITKSYSKVPAELVSLSTKNCQTCLGVRKYSKNKRPILNENEYSQQHSHPSQQQQQQLTCDTNSFSTSPSSSASSSTPQYHSHQQYQTLISKNEQGAMTPISPLLHPSNSGFFGASSTPLDSSFGQSQLNQFQQQQMQQLLQMHHAAMNAHHMSMTLDVGGIGSLSGLGHINTSQLYGSMSALDSACSTPTTMAKMDPNSMSNALVSFGQLAQQIQYQHALNNMGSPSDQYDHEQMETIGASLSSSSQYSPLLDEHYQKQQQHYQHAFQTNDSATTSYTTNDQQLQSTYSVAMSLTTMPLMQQHSQHPYEQQQNAQAQGYQHESSPLLLPSQLFQQQIQHEQRRFHQQQLSVSTSFSTLSGSGSSTSLSSPPPSAVPSWSCSITTPTLSPTPLLASVAHSNAFMKSHLHPAHALSGLVEHEQKSHLSAVADLVSAASHDL